MEDAALGHLHKCALGSPLLPDAKLAVDAAAVASLRSTGLRAKLLEALTSVIYHRVDFDEAAACFCLSLLFELSCNNSGSEVVVRDGKGKTGVLICGLSVNGLRIAPFAQPKAYAGFGLR